MHIERTVKKIKEYVILIYIAAIVAGIIAAACMGQQTVTPGEILYEQTRHP